MKKRNVVLVIVVAIVLSWFFVALLSSGAIRTKAGMIYFVGIVIGAAILSFIVKKYLWPVYQDRMKEKMIQEVINDPDKLVEKLKANGTLIDEGKQVLIEVVTDSKTGERKVSIKPGTRVHQEWRSKYEQTPLDKRGIIDDNKNNTADGGRNRNKNESKSNRSNKKARRDPRQASQTQSRKGRRGRADLGGQKGRPKEDLEDFDQDEDDQ